MSSSVSLDCPNFSASTAGSPAPAAPAVLADPNGPVIALAGIGRSFGPVRALSDVTLTIRPGDCIGLVGHNGAGKSTLMNILSGVLAPDTGRFMAQGTAVEGAFDIAAAARGGIRCVFQELSLCPNLTVAENARIMHRHLTGIGWRRRAAAMMMERLDEIFPGHGIRAADLLADLSIGKRQMVEIARAFTGRDLRLIILDEPTSSLDGNASEHLLRYVRARSAEGLAVVLISHMLGEILDTANRVVVMRDGRIVADRDAAGLSREDLVAAMGHVGAAARGGDGTPAGKSPAGEPVVEVAAASGIAFAARRGEIVGLAGLAGQGQTELLVDVLRASMRKTGRGGIRAGASAAFVAGDRQADGLFPLWSIGRNLTSRSVGGLRRGPFLSGASETALVGHWQRKVGIRGAAMEDGILSLSGGNQQKVLFARALASDARIILMDDPMRGVDVGTKRDVYHLIREEASQGRCFLWYTTETEELSNCDRVYVFRGGRIVAELAGAEIDEARILEASFAS